ncbi:MAG: urease accessory UreF family protein [Polyangiales bacterium]
MSGAHVGGLGRLGNLEPSGSVGAMGLLRLLWLASPALPIGAYAYSRGLEYAVCDGSVSNAASARVWIEGVLDRQVAALDAPVLARLHDAWSADSQDEVERWDDFLCAARESGELALEDGQLSRSLLRLLRDAGVPQATSAVGTRVRSYAAAFALACVHWGIARADAVLAYMFVFVESQVTAAIKLVPLGQSSGQQVLGALLGRIEQLAESALDVPDADLGSFTPGLALASALHETQYSRLFRS